MEMSTNYGVDIFLCTCLPITAIDHYALTKMAAVERNTPGVTRLARQA